MRRHRATRRAHVRTKSNEDADALWSVRQFRRGHAAGATRVEFRFPTKTDRGYITCKIYTTMSELRYRNKILDRFADYMPVFPSNVGDDDGSRFDFIKGLALSHAGSVDIMPLHTGFIDKDNFATYAAVINRSGASKNIGPFMLSDEASISDIRGNVDSYTNDVLRVAKESSFLAFGIGVGLAACLPSYLKLNRDSRAPIDGSLTETAVFNFSGKSSSGKSSICCAAIALTGSHERKATMNFSERGLSELAAASNDIVLVTDDTENAEHDHRELVRALKLIVHMVPGGRSKAISRGVDQDRFPNLKWSTFGLSSSPNPIPELAAQCGWNLSLGDKVRLFDIRVPSPKNGGIFDRIAKRGNRRLRKSRDLIETLQRGYSNNCGHVMPEWVAYLFQENRSAQIWRLVNEFVEATGSNGDGWETRFACKFGVVFAAMRLGIDAGILPWADSLPLKSTLKCYKRARQAATTDDELASTLIAKLNREIQAENFIDANRNQVAEVPAHCIGIRYKDKDGVILGLFDNALTKIAGGKRAKTILANKLIASGALPAVGNGKSRTVQVRRKIRCDGKYVERPRVWPISAEKFADLILSRERRQG